MTSAPITQTSNDIIRILHLEDNDADAYFVERLLRKAELPFTYKMVQSKHEFMSALQSFNPDVVLSDHSIPSFSSNDALAAVRKRGPRIPFILLTGTASEEFAVEMMREGAEDYILKDRLQRLPKAILHALERVKSESAKEKYLQDIISREKRFRALIENSQEAIILLDADFISIFRSQSANKITEWDENKHNQLGFLEDTHPDDIAFVNQMILDTKSQPGTSLNTAFRVRHNKGYYIWVEVTVKNMLDDPDVQAYVVNYRDITAKKEAERELVRKEKHYRALIENISDAIILVDENAQVIYHSPSVKGITGIDFSETNGKVVFDFIHQGDRDRAKGFFKRVFAHPETPINSSFRVLKKNGEYIWAEGTITNLLDDEAVKALVINYRDITHRREVEELIHRSEAKLRTMLDNTSVAYILTNTRLEVSTFNVCAREQFQKDFGTNLQEGQPFISFFAPDRKELLTSYFDRVLYGEKISYEFTSPDDGDISWYHVKLSPVYDADRSILGIMMAREDITVRKQRELERGRLTRDIIRHNRDLEQFAYIVSHNLRSPVANILGLSNILQQQNQLSASEFAKCLAGISLSVSKLDDVIHDLNLILQSRQTTNEKREDVFFNELVENVRTSISGLIEKQNVTIKTDFKVKSFFSIKGFMHSVLFNLISNSIKYRHPSRDLVIEVSTDVIEDKLLLKVRDNGLGLDLKLNKDKVFGLYKKFHAHIEGKGMGLYMVKTQVESLGGRISINSEVDKGTEFIIRFDR